MPAKTIKDAFMGFEKVLNEDPEEIKKRKEEEQAKEDEAKRASNYLAGKKSAREYLTK